CASGDLEGDLSGYKLSESGRAEYELLRTLSGNTSREVFATGACASVRALPVAVVRSAMSREPAPRTGAAARGVREASRMADRAPGPRGGLGRREAGHARRADRRGAPSRARRNPRLEARSLGTLRRRPGCDSSRARRARDRLRLADRGARPLDAKRARPRDDARRLRRIRARHAPRARARRA